MLWLVSFRLLVIGTLFTPQIIAIMCKLNLNYKLNKFWCLFIIQSKWWPDVKQNHFLFSLVTNKIKLFTNVVEKKQRRNKKIYSVSLCKLLLLIFKKEKFACKELGRFHRSYKGSALLTFNEKLWLLYNWR